MTTLPTAIVTSGAQSVGKATAKRLLEKGMNVVVADMYEEEEGIRPANMSAWETSASPGRCNINAPKFEAVFLSSRDMDMKSAA